MNEEVWKDIEGYEGLYQVSNMGRVRSLDHYVIHASKNGSIANHFFKGRQIKPHYDGRDNYLQFGLCKDGETKQHLVHRLVAKAFLAPPIGKNEVNHIDGDKTNNKVNNLEWATKKENLQHALKTGLVECQCKIRRKVKIYNDKETIWFNSMKDAAKFFGFKRGWLQNRIRKSGNLVYQNGYNIEIFGSKTRSYASFKSRAGRTTLCIELGIVFENAALAARFIGIRKSGVVEAIFKGHKCKGYHWRYV